MKNTRRILIALLLTCILLAGFIGCKGGSGSKFKISYVGAGNVFGAGMFINGTYQDKEYRIPLDSFRGYSVSGFSFPDPGSVSITGTSDGRFAFPEGIILELKDDSGTPRSVELGEGVTFDAVLDGDTLTLILP